MALILKCWGVLGLPTSVGGGLMMEVLLLTIPIWIGIFVGVLAGWAWRPSWWARLGRKKIDSLISKLVDFSLPCSTSSSLGFHSIYALNTKIFSCPEALDQIRANDTNGDANCCSSQKKGEEHSDLNEGDIRYLYRLVEVDHEGPSWIQTMDRSNPTMSYRAWRTLTSHNAGFLNLVVEVCASENPTNNGPPHYCTSSIFEDAMLDMAKDFFWDDEFRMKWDKMLIDAKTLKESQTTSTMMVQWVRNLRKFPFFCHSENI